jgi:PAS domain S-box-containing protein
VPGKLSTLFRILLYIFIIVLMANVSALTDAVIHPGIPYFNLAHFIVGGMMAFLSTIICATIEVNHNHSKSPEASTRLAQLVWFMAIIWTVIIFSSLAGNIIGKKDTNLEIALQEARTVYTKDLNYYRWATGHKGVFVPVTETTTPNPYLSHIPEYKLETTSGLKLTLVNPEYMIRQVYEMQTAAHEVLGHITSLDPIRAENAADPWEQKALDEFESGAKEVSSIEQIGGRPYLRLMRPMITEEGCLKCHAMQGYDVGDIRGGISVSIPMTHLNELAVKDIATYTLGHVGLWILGLLGIFMGSNRIHMAITEREEAEAKTRSIIDNMFDGLIITEEDAFIESLNSTAASMFDYRSAGELRGQHLTLLVPELLGTMKQGEAGGASIRPGRYHEVEGRRKDGAVFPLEMSISKMHFGAKMFFIAIVRDITEEKILKAESLQAGKLAAIGELAAGVAHEINNPINGMINYAQILQDEMSAAGNTEQGDILKRIIKEGDRVAGIVRNLLAFARQRDEDVGDISLKEILADCISLVKHQLGKEGIIAAIEVPDDLPALHGNPQQLQQVFLNALSNARYALNQRFPGLDPRKRIEIKSQAISFGDKTIIRTTVTDYGCGIAPDAIDHIFDSMFSTKPAGQGTGLGLSISRDLIQAHHGFIHVESRLGDHTTLTVDLPAQKAMGEV